MFLGRERSAGIGPRDNLRPAGHPWQRADDGGQDAAIYLCRDAIHVWPEVRFQP